MTRKIRLNWARKQIIQERILCSKKIIEKIFTVKIKPLKNGTLSRFGKESFGKEFRTLAFYDPNKHIIYFNVKFINKADGKLVHEILIHELIHAISDHSTIKIPGLTILKSGLKRQFFTKKKDGCDCKALNEGLVQYLCNKVIGRQSLSYRYEVEFITKLISLVGEETLIEAFVSDDVSIFEDKIDERFGREKFSDVCRKLDQGKYTIALRIINQSINDLSRAVEPTDCELNKYGLGLI
ncbi:MAG: hypothetical protein Q7S37_03070 [bacterium]|nr:hypothetical protein [bacterium]